MRYVQQTRALSGQPGPHATALFNLSQIKKDRCGLTNARRRLSVIIIACTIVVSDGSALKARASDLPSGICADTTVHFVSNYSAYFEPGSKEITARYRTALMELVQYYKRAGEKGHVVLRGNFDTAEAAAHSSLDLERANSVQDFLLSLGMPRSVISVAADGSSNPLLPTGPDTPEGQNRYVLVLPYFEASRVRQTLNNCAKWIRSSCEGEHPSGSLQACGCAWDFLEPDSAP